MLLELGRMISLLLSILSLHALLASAFFVPGTRWDERLLHSLLRILIAACVCFASGLIFTWQGDWHEGWQGQNASNTDDGDPIPAASAYGSGAGVLNTLPVKLFAWALLGMTLLFAISWYLETYYVPMLWRNQPR